MTNRDYLRTLSNEKLAELLEGSGICDCLIGLIETCPNGDCTKCIANWLGAERKPNVEEGQIREIDSHKWLVGSVSINRDICGMVSETGVIRYIPMDIVDTWKIVTDETEEMFYNRVSNKLKKEINKKI